MFIKNWYGDYGLAGINFCETFSDWKITYIFFETHALTYFGQAFRPFEIEDIKFSEDIYTPDFNYDSLKVIQQLYAARRDSTTNPAVIPILEDSIRMKFERYTASIKKYHPYLVYIKTPLMLTKNFMLQAGVHNLYYIPYSHQPMHRKLIKLFFICIYVTVFGSFIAGLLFYKQLFENKLILLAYIIAFYLIFIHSIFLRSIEPRYIIPAFPFFVTGAVFCITSALKSLNIKINR